MDCDRPFRLGGRYATRPRRLPALPVPALGAASILDDGGQGSRRRGDRLVYGVVHVVSSRLGGGWDLGPRRAHSRLCGGRPVSRHG